MITAAWLTQQGPLSHWLYPKDRAPSHQLAQGVNSTFGELGLGEGSLVVVGLMGHSSQARSWLASTIAERPLFKNVELGESGPFGSVSHVQLAHDPTQGVLFLSLTTAQDDALILNLLDLEKKLSEDPNEEDLLAFLNTKEAEALKAQFFFFSICNVILFAGSPDVLMERLWNQFHFISGLKQKSEMMDHLTASLKLPDLRSASQFCPGNATPNLIFVVDKDPVPPLPPSALNEADKNAADNLDKLKKLMEAEIVRGLDDIEANALKTRNKGSKQGGAGGGGARSQQGQKRTPKAQAPKPKPLIYLDKTKVIFIKFPRNFPNREMSELSELLYATPLGSLIPRPPVEEALEAENATNIGNLKEWIRGKVDFLRSLSKGQNVKEASMMPSGRSWFSACQVLQDYVITGKSLADPATFFTASSSTATSTPIPTLYAPIMRAALDALEKAKQEYLKDLPPLYPSSLHLQRLLKSRQAVEVATAPELRAIVVRVLQETLVSHWESGHRQCDACSLTGKPCNNKLHLLLDTDADPRSSSRRKGLANHMSLPVAPHSSGVAFTRRCLCGKEVVQRLDPFDPLEVGMDSFALGCCWEVLVETPFSPSSSVDSRSSSIDGFQFRESLEVRLVKLGIYDSYNYEVGIPQNGFINNYNSLLPWEVKFSKTNRGEIPIALTKTEPEEKRNDRRGRKGKKGGGGGGGGGERGGGGAKHELSLGDFVLPVAVAPAGPSSIKLLIGVEYETDNGQRFIMNDELFQKSSSSSQQMKRFDAQRLMASGLPMTMAMPNGSKARLQRLYVLTPPSQPNVKITLDPIVQFESRSETKESKKRLLFLSPKPVDIPFDSLLVIPLPMFYLYPERSLGVEDDEERGKTLLAVDLDKFGGILAANFIKVELV